jgi:hypothetical protein
MKHSSILLSIIFLIIFSFNHSFAQTASVKFEVKVPSTGMQKDSTVFLAGSFNCWNPHDSLYIMKKSGYDLYSLVIPVFDGIKYTYKYTLGDWNTVEIAPNDSEINNRQMISHDGLTIWDTVAKWKIPPAPQPEDTTLGLTTEQFNELSKLKEEIGKKFESHIANTFRALKKALANMLSEKPDMKLRKKYHKEAVKNINDILDIAANTMWKVSAMLTPEQKKAILTEINNSKEPGNIFSIMGKVMSTPGK